MCPSSPGRAGSRHRARDPLGDASSTVLKNQSCGSPSLSTRVFSFLCPLGGELLRSLTLLGPAAWSRDSPGSHVKPSWHGKAERGHGSSWNIAACSIPLGLPPPAPLPPAASPRSQGAAPMGLELALPVLWGAGAVGKANGDVGTAPGSPRAGYEQWGLEGFLPTTCSGWDQS